MKIIITESQYKNILDTYLNKIIKSPKFDFVDHIDVNRSTTKESKWQAQYEMPVIDYIINLKEDALYDIESHNNDLSDLYEKIGDIHKILFPQKKDGTPSAYYHISHL
jgi:hypothetical protein